MNNDDLSRSGESTKSNNSKEYAGLRLSVTERHLLILPALLLCSVLLIIFDKLLFAGFLIIVSASLDILLYKKVSALEKNFAESIGALKKTDTKKDKLITDFSHKIREPLNNLVITGEMFSDTDPTPKQKVLLETFLDSIKSMVSTVNELTIHSAEYMSHESRKHIRFNILSTIEHVTELYRSKDKTGIIFKVNMEEGVESECIGDPVIIKQILLDLISGIERQYSGRSIKADILINTEKRTEDEGVLSIKIITEPGIDLIPDKSPEGMHLSRLISLSKGRYYKEIIANSSILNISLDIRHVPPEITRKTPSTKIEELIQKEKTKKELKDLRVLLVEDNLINQKITLLTLQPLVQSIDTATNGKEALEMFGTNNYDLILMDIQMPVMNGLTAIEKIRALESTTNSHVPIIAITANAMIGDKEKCLSSGADDYISKPFQPINLVEKIRLVI